MALHGHTPAQRKRLRGKSAAARAKAPGQRKKVLPIPPPSAPTVSGTSFPRLVGPISGTTSRTTTRKRSSVTKRKAAKKKRRR